MIERLNFEIGHNRNFYRKTLNDKLPNKAIGNSSLQWRRQKVDSIGGSGGSEAAPVGDPMSKNLLPA